MTSIWSVLIQTINVSIIATIILLLKWLFKDKLSPRWQYQVWIILVVGILFPVGYFQVYIVPQLNILFETIKVMVEKLLNSSYIDVYELIYNQSIIPIIHGKPQSVTDYLFIIYVIGLMAYLMIYFIRYIKLRISLKRGKEANQETLNQIKRICETYLLKECRTVVVEQFPSPFVFGVFHPVLVLPSEKRMDDKVLLHELLHLKYKDALQSMLWSSLKALHWFNPFLRIVFQSIHNDMESLCDQRVLELLEGEERREYGKILLSMTNDKYPSYFGTTSISNGGQFIKKRIEAIVRFKKYPKGMKIASICIIVLLFPLAIGGTGSIPWIDVSAKSEFAYELSMASARMYQCPTMAGAIDVYVKGLLTSNDLYLTSTMPLHQQLNYKESLKNVPQISNSNNNQELYRVSGMSEINENEYTANLLFYNSAEVDNLNPETNEPYIDFEEDYVGTIDEYQYSVIPIKLIYENGWKVEQSGEVIHKEFHDVHWDAIAYQISNQKIVKELENMSLEIDVSTYQYIPQFEYSGSSSYTIHKENSVSYGTNYLFSYEPIPNATFSRSYQNVMVTLNHNLDYDYNIKLFLTKLGSLEEEVNYDIDYSSHGNLGGSGDNYAFQIIDPYVPKGWDNLRVHFENEEFLCDNDPQYFALQVSLDGEVIEEFRFEVKGDSNE